MCDLRTLLFAGSRNTLRGMLHLFYADDYFKRVKVLSVRSEVDVSAPGEIPASREDSVSASGVCMPWTAMQSGELNAVEMDGTLNPERTKLLLASLCKPHIWS